jgi:hypothetical protein
VSVEYLLEGEHLLVPLALLARELSLEAAALLGALALALLQRLGAHVRGLLALGFEGQLLFFKLLLQALHLEPRVVSQVPRVPRRVDRLAVPVRQLFLLLAGLGRH